MIFCLAGDGGYPLRRWLLTPVLNAQSAEEQRYNEVHGRARSVVERAIGLLKCRWRALDASGGGFYTSLPKCAAL